MAAGSGANLGRATGRVDIDTQVAGRALQQLRTEFKSTKAEALDLNKAFEHLQHGLNKGGQGIGAGLDAPARRAKDSAAALEHQQQQLANAQIRAATASKNYGEALRIIDRELAKVGPETKRYNDLLAQQARVQAHVTREVEKTRAELRQNLSTMSSALGGLALPMVAAGTAAGVMGVRFDSALRSINSIAKLSEAELQQLGQQFLELSTDTSKTREGASALAEGFYSIQSSGYAGAAAMVVLERSTKGASAGMTETAVSSKALTAIMNAYGVDANNLNQVTRESGRVMDVLFKTVDRGVTTFPELAAQIGDVIGSAAAAKIPIEQVGSAIATMTKDGQSANKAITNLNSLINSVIKPTKEAAEAAEEYSIDLSLTALQTKGLVGFLADMNAKTNGNVEAMAKMIGTQEGLKAVLSLTKGDLKAFNEDLAAMGQAAGATDAAFAEMGKSQAAQLQELRQQFERLAIVVGSQILPRVVSAAKAVNELVSSFNKLPADEQEKYIDIALAVGGAVVGLFAFVKAVEGTIAVVTAAKAAYGLMTTAAATLTTGIKGVTAATLVSAGPFALVAAGIGLAIYAYTQYQATVQKNIQAIDAQSEALQRALEAQQRFEQAQAKGEQSNAASKELNDLLAQRAALVEQIAKNETFLDQVRGSRHSGQIEARRELKQQQDQLQQLDSQISTSTEKLEAMAQADAERARAAEIANNTALAGLVNIEHAAKLSVEELDKLFKALQDATTEAGKAFASVVNTEAGFLQERATRRAAHEEEIKALTAKGATDQVAELQKKYADEERAQAESYARQQAAQVQHLGEQLIRYVQAQADLKVIDEGRAAELIETFRKQYGVLPDLVNDTFGEAKAVIDQYGQDTRISADAAGQAIQGNIDLAVDLKQKYDALIGTYTAELEAKKTGLSPEEYTAELLKIPQRAYTEVTSNADEAKAKIEALNPVITSIRDRYIEFKDNTLETKGRFEDLGQAVRDVPPVRDVNIQTNAAQAAAQIRSVTDAVRSLPKYERIRIEGDIDSMFRRRSPAPIEQVLDRVDTAGKNPTRLRVTAEGAETIERVVSALGKIAAVTPTLGNVGSGSAARAGIDTLFSQLRTVADRASVDAKAYNAKTLEALNGYLDTGTKAVGLASQGADAFGKLVDYVGPTRESLLGFSFNVRDVVADAFHRQRETNYAITKGVNDYLDTATKGVSLIGSGTDAFKKLKNYEGPLRESLLGFSFNVRDVVADAAARARENEGDLGTLTTTWLETAGQAVELLGKGADGFAALKDFAAPQREALLAFFIATGLAVAFAGQYAHDNEQALDELTTRWLETAGKTVELLGTGSENLQALEDFESPSREALTRFFVAAADAAKEAAARAQEIAPDLQAAGATFAETAGKVLAPISNGVDGFNKLGELGEVPERNLDLLIAGFVVAARKMGEAARQVDQEMLPEAVGFATSADAVVKPISSGVDAFNKLKEYKSPAAEVIELIGSDIKRAVALMILLSSQMDKDGVQAAAIFSEALDKVFSGLKAGIDTLDALRDYENVPQQRMDAIQGDFARALAMMHTLRAQAGTFRTYAQGWEQALRQGAASLRAGLGELSGLDGLGVSLNARIDVATTGATGGSSGTGSPAPGGGTSFFQSNPTLQALTTPRRAEPAPRSTSSGAASSTGGSRDVHVHFHGDMHVRSESDIHRIALEVASIMQARGSTP